MSDEAAKQAINDPLKSVADALDAAVHAAKQGVDEVTATASGAIPAVNGFLAGLTYKACYAISYGVVFPTVLVARAIPKENAVVHGLIDGARAAIDLVDEKRPKSRLGGNSETSSPDNGTVSSSGTSGS